MSIISNLSFYTQEKYFWGQATFTRSNWNRREGGRAQPLKEWHIRGHDINWLEQNRSKKADCWLPLELEPQYTLIVTHQQAKWHTRRCHDSSKADHRGQKVGGGPIPGNPHHFPKIAGILLPLISLWNYPRL